MAAISNGGLGTFTARTTPTDTSWSAIAYSPSLERFVAVSYDGISSPVLTSDDGVTWTPQTAGTTAQIWLDVIWVESLGLFVAVSDASGEAENVMTSPDGEVWTLRTAPDEGWQAVAWNGTTLVAVSYNSGTSNVMTSTNGTSWTGQTSSGIPFGLTDIAWSPTLSLFAGCDAGNIYSSANGIDWTIREDANQRTDRIVWADSLAKFFVLSDDPAGIGNGGVYASTNGTSWTFTEFDVGTLASPRVLVWAESVGLLFALGSGSTEIVSSANGTDWTLGTTISDDWYDGVWSEELGMLAVASIAASGTTAIATAPYSASPRVTGLDHLEGQEVSVVADGVVLASPNNAEYAPVIVTNGAIDLPAGTYTTVTVGLPYTTDIQTLDIDAVGTTVKERGMQVGGVIAWIEETGSFYAGPVVPTGDTLTGLERYTPQNDQGYDVTGPVTGVAEVTLQSTYNNTGRVLIRQVDPVPLTILSIAPTGFLNGGR
jgi:hypothetical protein